MQRVEQLAAEVVGASWFPGKRGQRLEDRGIAGHAAVLRLDTPNRQDEPALDGVFVFDACEDRTVLLRRVATAADDARCHPGAEVALEPDHQLGLGAVVLNDAGQRLDVRKRLANQGFAESARSSLLHEVLAPLVERFRGRGRGILR